MPNTRLRQLNYTSVTSTVTRGQKTKLAQTSNDIWDKGINILNNLTSSIRENKLAVEADKQKIQEAANCFLQSAEFYSEFDEKTSKATYNLGNKILMGEAKKWENCARKRSPEFKARVCELALEAKQQALRLIAARKEKFGEQVSLPSPSVPEKANPEKAHKAMPQAVSNATSAIPSPSLISTKLTTSTTESVTTVTTPNTETRTLCVKTESSFSSTHKRKRNETEEKLPAGGVVR